MAAATFGELLALGREHMDAAGGLPDSTLRGETVVAAAPVIGRLALTLSRYLADVAPYTMAEVITSRYLGQRMRAAVDAREALRVAAAGMRPGTGDAGGAEAEPADPLPARLAAAATSMAAGRDLLHTHFSAGPDGQLEPRSGWSAVVLSAPVSWALTAEVARWSRQLAVLTSRLSLACEADRTIPAPLGHELAEASGWFLTASTALTMGQRDHPGSASGAELLHAIPVNTAPARQVHSEGETIAGLVSGVAVSAARLSVITQARPEGAAWSPVMTADSWHWTASAAAVAYHVSNLMLRSLAGRRGPAADLLEQGSQLDAAAETAASACARWREVAAAWRRLTTETRGRAAPGLADASDLVIQLGRIAFTSPQWTPARARRAVPRAPADLAPDPRQAAAVVSAIHHAADVLARVAAADLRAVSTAIRASRLHTLTRTLPEELDVPYRYGNAAHVQTAALLDAYRAASAASDGVMTNLNALAVTMNTPSRILAVASAAVQSPSVPDAVTRRAASIRPAWPASASPGSRIPAAALPPGTVEEALRVAGIADLGLLLRASMIDKAALQLIEEAKESIRELGSPGPAGNGRRPVPPARTAAQVAASSFPVSPTASTTGRQTASPSLRARSAAGELTTRQTASPQYTRHGRL